MVRTGEAYTTTRLNVLQERTELTAEDVTSSTPLFSLAQSASEATSTQALEARKCQPALDA